MIDSYLRKYVQKGFDSASVPFIRRGISPDTVSIAAFVVGLIAGALASFDMMIPAVILLWVSGFLDVMDGTIARKTGQSSAAGAFMDLIFDRLVECAFVAGLALSYPSFSFVYILFLISVIFNFSTFMAAGALFPNNGEKGMFYSPGLAERSETFIVFTLCAIFPDYISLLLGLFTLIIFITGSVRFSRIMRYNGSV